VTGPRTHEQELRDAIRAARLPARDFRIYDALFARATWKTAVIVDKYQPHSLEELAEWARMSRANLCYGLNHLEYHGWLIRQRRVKPGRGHKTMYELLAGRDCNDGCPMRKASKASNPWTLPKAESVQESSIKASNPWTLPKAESVQESSIKASNDFRGAAGQRPVPRKSVYNEEEEVRESGFPGVENDPLVLDRIRRRNEAWPAGSIGEYENRRRGEDHDRSRGPLPLPRSVHR
jgi:biotin operon repressor